MVVWGWTALSCVPISLSRDMTAPEQKEIIVVHHLQPWWMCSLQHLFTQSSQITLFLQCPSSLPNRSNLTKDKTSLSLAPWKFLNGCSSCCDWWVENSPSHHRDGFANPLCKIKTDMPCICDVFHDVHGVYATVHGWLGVLQCLHHHFMPVQIIFLENPLCQNVVSKYTFS